MIKIYGSVLSSSGRCIWMAEEIGQEWENVPVDFKNREHKSAPYLKLNPNGKVPVVTDGDYVIWESVAINTYLAEKYQPALLGLSLEERGHVHQWNYWAVANIALPVEVLTLQKWRSTPDNEQTAAARKELDRFLPILENELIEKTYLVGNAFTIADLDLVSYVAGLLWAGIEMTAYSNIVRWFTGIAQRPAFQKTIAKKGEMHA